MTIAVMLSAMVFWGSGKAAVVSAAPNPPAAQTVSAQTIRSAVRGYIQKQAPWRAEQLHIRPIRYERDVDVAPGTLRLVVAAPKHTDWLGSMLFAVQIKVNGRVAKKINVPAAIEVHSPVVMTAKPLGRNQPITADDLRVVEMNLARAPANALTDTGRAIGCTANRAIAVNAILTSAQVVQPPVVRRGDIVRIVAESGDLQVSTQGLVRQDGGEGERIRVMNLNSQKIIFAKVLDAQSVCVEF